MPGLDDWLNCPLDVAQRIFSENETEDWSKKVVDYFREKLSERDGLSWVPSLNDQPQHHLKPNTLVKFRCMIQDMFDPEFYPGSYQLRNTTTGQIVKKTGIYHDLSDNDANLEVVCTKAMDRQTLYCVPVPGETPWVKDNYVDRAQKRTAFASTSTALDRIKRGREQEAAELQDPASMEMDEDGECKRSRLTSGANEGGTVGGEQSTTTSVTAGPPPPGPPNLNFPLPGETGPSCLVKVYENFEDYKLNDVMEFVGVLSVDPALAQNSFNGGGEQQMESSIIEPNTTNDWQEEVRARNPPPSLVPRIHAILGRKLEHTNPLITAEYDGERAKALLLECGQIREELRTVLQHLLYGDSLAAEYLLLHLASSVYARRDVMAVGKFSLNVSGCPPSSNLAQPLYQLMQELLTKCFLLPLSLSNMNTLKMVPKKDYSANRLCTGVLQLSDRTHLILDEMALEPGQLDNNGVQNVTALGNLIMWQKVDYEFNFHQQQFLANIPVLTISEGKSLLPSDCQVALVPRAQHPDSFAAVRQSLTDEILNKFRRYLGLLTLVEYQMSEDIQKKVEEDFVAMRKMASLNVTADDLHSLLTISRLLSLTLGKSTLTMDTWRRAKNMEFERKKRLKDTTTSSLPNQ